MPSRPRTLQFRLDFDVHDALITTGIVLIVLKTMGLAPIGWVPALAPFVLAWAWKTAFRTWASRFRARHAVRSELRPNDLATGFGAVGWSVAMGLLPGYGHGNVGGEVSLDDRRVLLAASWARIMATVEAETGLLVSAVLTEGRTLYPTSLGCPDGGEAVVTLSGSSNPTRVGPDQFDAYVEAVEKAVHLLRETMEQNSVRIEFTRIARSSYFRADGRY